MMEPIFSNAVQVEIQGDSILRFLSRENDFAQQ
jgi:hypothetical protein